MLLQLVVLAALAYVGYRFFGWPGAAVVVVGWFVLTYVYRAWQSRASTKAAVNVISTPLSDAEKMHMNMMRERDQRMAERQASKNKSHR